MEKYIIKNMNKGYSSDRLKSYWETDRQGRLTILNQIQKFLQRQQNMIMIL